jgi:hypothetical protein
MNSIKYTTVFLTSFLMVACSNLEHDLFIGDTPSNEEAWHNAEGKNEAKQKDIELCSVLSWKKFPDTSFNPNWTTEEKKKDRENFFEKNHFFQRCMLDKGYKYHPRGLDGKKATACNGDWDGPACKSVRWWD